jgi:hypothetical protein
MKFSIEWTPRMFYLKGIFFFLLFSLIAFGHSFTHGWTDGRIAFVILGFGFVCLEFRWGYRRRNEFKQR